MQRQFSGRGDRRDDMPSFSLDKDAVEKILGGDGEAINEYAEDLADRLIDFSKSRMRSFYGPVVQLKAQQLTADRPVKHKVDRLQLMRPRLAYLSKRDGGRNAENLKKALDILVPAIGDSQERLEAFFDFIEAVVAYHYQKGKRN